MRILALGDSLTAGYQLKPNESFPAQLQASLQAQGLPVRVHNAGVSGDTTAQAKARLPWVLNSLKQKPDLAIVALGANDMLRGHDPASVRDGLDKLMSRLKTSGAPVLIAGMMAAPNLGADYAARFNPIYPELAGQYGALLYPFFLDGVASDAGLNQSDGMHPNAAGVDVIVGRMLPSVEALIERIDSRS